MPRACSVCTSPNRAELDEALAANRGSFRGVARQYGLSPDAVERHARAHLPKVLALAAGAREAARGDSLLDKVRQLEEDARRIQRRAEREGDLRCAVGATKVLVDLVGTLTDVSKALADRGRVDGDLPSSDSFETAVRVANFLANIAARAGIDLHAPEEPEAAAALCGPQEEPDAARL